MSKNQRIALFAGGGLLVLILIYRYVHNAGSANTAATTTAAPDSSQYAALAGQEQSDVAGLQSQEQSDVQNLVAANTQLGQDFTNALTDATNTLTGAQTQFEQNIGTVIGASTAAQNKNISAIASGQAKEDRVLAALTRLTPGAILASTSPSSKKPKAPKGEKTVGIGKGFWEYVKVKATPKPTHPKGWKPSTSRGDRHR